jgi:Ser/Thr protein kinase RdoA (MazF antagonist)
VSGAGVVTRVTSDLGAVAEAFGLGTPVAPAAALPGGSPAGRWRLRADRGCWMVKTYNAPAAWEREQMRDAGALEQGAYAAGVAMPRPVPPRGPALGLWQPVGTGYARVAEWVEGSQPAEHTMALARWLGRTLAAIDGLGLPADPSAGVAYRLHPIADWRRWLGDARAAGLLDHRETVEALAAVADATSLVAAGLATRPVFQLGHRDANPRNFLHTDRGTMLIDFDAAGPEVPWWGAVYHAWDLARADIPGLAPAVLDAYEDNGGRRGPAEATAFAGAVRGVLDGFAFHVRLATAKAAVDPDRRAHARRYTGLFSRGVPEMMAMIEGWVGLLR